MSLQSVHPLTISYTTSGSTPAIRASSISDGNKHSGSSHRVRPISSVHAAIDLAEIHKPSFEELRRTSYPRVVLFIVYVSHGSLNGTLEVNTLILSTARAVFLAHFGVLIALRGIAFELDFLPIFVLFRASSCDFADELLARLVLCVKDEMCRLAFLTLTWRTCLHTKSPFRDFSVERTCTRTTDEASS